VVALFQSLPKIRNRDQRWAAEKRLKSRQFCVEWKLPFCHNKVTKCTQNCVCFANQWVSGPVAPSTTLEYHPKVLEPLDMLDNLSTIGQPRQTSLDNLDKTQLDNLDNLSTRRIAVYFQLVLVWISGETKFLCLCGVKFHFLLVAHSKKTIENECMLKDCWEDASSIKTCLQKASGWFCNSQLWHPRRLGCDCLSNPYRLCCGLSSPTPKQIEQKCNAWTLDPWLDGHVNTAPGTPDSGQTSGCCLRDLQQRGQRDRRCRYIKVS